MSKVATKKPVKAKAAAGKKQSAKTARAASNAKTKAGKPAPEPAADPFYLNLEANCTLRETADLQFSLVAARGNPVVVDASGVRRIDTSGLQLLVALALREQAAGRRLEWKAASDELRKCSRRLGLDEALGLGEAA